MLCHVTSCNVLSCDALPCDSLPQMKRPAQCEKQLVHLRVRAWDLICNKPHYRTTGNLTTHHITSLRDITSKRMTSQHSGMALRWSRAWRASYRQILFSSLYISPLFSSLLFSTPLFSSLLFSTPLFFELLDCNQILKLRSSKLW